MYKSIQCIQCMHRRKRRTRSLAGNNDPTQPEPLQLHQPVFFTMTPLYDELIDLDKEKNDAYDHPEGTPSRPTSNIYQDLEGAAAAKPASDVDQGMYIHPDLEQDSDVYIHPKSAPDDSDTYINSDSARDSDAFKQYEGPEQPLVSYI